MYLHALHLRLTHFQSCNLQEICDNGEHEISGAANCIDHFHQLWLKFILFFLKELRKSDNTAEWTPKIVDDHRNKNFLSVPQLLFCLCYSQNGADAHFQLLH